MARRNHLLGVRVAEVRFAAKGSQVTLHGGSNVGREQRLYEENVRLRSALSKLIGLEEVRPADQSWWDRARAGALDLLDGEDDVISRIPPTRSNLPGRWEW